MRRALGVQERILGRPDVYGAEGAVHGHPGHPPGPGWNTTQDMLLPPAHSLKFILQFEGLYENEKILKKSYCADI